MELHSAVPVWLLGLEIGLMQRAVTWPRMVL